MANYWEEKNVQNLAIIQTLINNRLLVQKNHSHCHQCFALVGIVLLTFGV